MHPCEVREYREPPQPTSLIVVTGYRRYALPTYPTAYRAPGIGGGQFGVDGRQTGAGPPSEKWLLADGMGGGQFGVDGRQTGAGPPSENPTVWVFEVAIAETVPSSIKPASKVVATDFMAVPLLNCWYPD